MPNFCNNHLNVSGSTEELHALLNAVRGTIDDNEVCISLQKILPCPMGWDYDWCCENWGTKWDVSDPEAWIDDNFVEFSFQTAWAPPRPVIQALAKMFPSLRFNHEYWEPSVLIYGHDIYENGVKFSFIPSCDEEEEALCLYKEDGCFFLDEYKDAVESYDAETVNNAIGLFSKYNLISDREIPSMCPLAPAATA